jgi:hypothetical protein
VTPLDRWASSPNGKKAPDRGKRRGKAMTVPTVALSVTSNAASART